MTSARPMEPGLADAVRAGAAGLYPSKQPAT